MKLLETSLGREIGGGFFQFGLAPEPRFSGEGNPRVAPSQIPPMQIRPSNFTLAVSAGYYHISFKRH